MFYLVGIISGAVSGIGMILLTNKMDAAAKMGLTKGQNLFIQIFAFLLLTFLAGPLLSYLFAKRYALQGTSAISSYLISNAFISITIGVMGLFQYKHIWKMFLVYYILFISGLCWLLPCLNVWIGV